MSEEKLKDFGFISKVQKSSKTDPDIKPGESAIEYMQRLEREKLSSRGTPSPFPYENGQQPDLPGLNNATQPSNGGGRFDPRPGPPPQQQQQQPPQEVIFYEGYKLPRDFFTCMTICIMKLNNPEIKKTMAAFGFEMKDMNGKPVIFKKKTTKRKQQKKRK